MIDRDTCVKSCYVIPGQTWPQELCWLYDRLAASKHHAEVGVWCGRSLFAACGGMQVATVYAVDIDQPGVGAALPDASWVQAVLSATIAAIEARGTVTVKPLMIGSLDAARSLYRAEVVLDSVFIDGSHHYADVVADIEEWLPLVKSGGLICGHDYSTAFPGVMDAVNYLLPGFEVVPNTRIWWMTK